MLRRVHRPATAARRRHAARRLASHLRHRVARGDGGHRCSARRLRPTRWYTGDLTMTFNNGVPQSVTLRIPRDSSTAYFPDLGIYVQDRWTFKRATLTGGAALRLLSSARVERRHAAREPLESVAVLPGVQGADLEGPLASRRRRLRCVRQRQDRDQGERLALRRSRRRQHGAGQQPADTIGRDRHAHLARSERRFHDLQPRRVGADGRARPDQQRRTSARSFRPRRRRRIRRRSTAGTRAARPSNGRSSCSTS